MLLGFLVDVLERVARERPQLGADRAAAPLPCAASISSAVSSSPTASFSPSRQSAPSRSSTHLAVVDLVHHRRCRPRRAAGSPRGDDPDRAAVRVTARDRLARRSRPRRRPAATRLSAATRSMSRWSMIAMSPRPDARGEILGAAADARDADDRGRGRRDAGVGASSPLTACAPGARLATRASAERSTAARARAGGRGPTRRRRRACARSR